MHTQIFIPFKGNGWYSYPIVKYGLDNNIINGEDIKHEIIPSYTLQNNLFVPFVKYILSQYNESFDLLFKNIINSYIGTLGSKVKKTGKFFITDNVQEAAYCCMKYNNFPYQTDGLYEVHDCTKEYKEDSYIPIFNHILDLEAIELHKMQQLLESFGGKTVYLNTDQVVAKFETNIQINKAKQAVKLQFWDNEETLPKYKFDNNIKHKEIIPSFVSYDEFVLEKHEWKITPDCQHNDFKQFSNDLVQNIGSFCFNGRLWEIKLN